MARAPRDTGIVELKLTEFLARDLLRFLDGQSTLPPVARAFRMELATRLQNIPPVASTGAMPPAKVKKRRPLPPPIAWRPRP
ncbi:MAG: hypothetical protein ACXVHB_05995 [Solirubrobacteraceae bacterium]